MKKQNKAMIFFARIWVFIKLICLKILSNPQLNKILDKFRKLQPKYKALIIVFLFVLLGFFGYKYFFPSAGYQEAKVVEVHKASKENLLVKIDLLGTISAKKYYIATSGHSGVIDFIADSGTRLKKGERIAHISEPEIDKAYEFAQASAKIADERYKREIALSNSKATSKYAVESKYIELSNAQTNLATAKQNLDKILFTAPFDGIVGSPLFHVGSKINPNAEIVAFYDPSELVVKFDIPSKILPELGDRAKVTIDGQEYTTSFLQKILSTNAYTVPAFIDLTCAKCIIGEAIDLELTILDKKDIITLPASCVFIQNGATMVYKVKENKAEISPVKLGSRYKNTVEILEGVELGDLIITEGQARLYPTIPVKIYNPQVK